MVGGRSVGSYAVVYPANKNFLAASEGANDMSGRISYMAGACPNTKLVLGGYSQGAAVVDVVAAVPVPALSFGNPLSPELADRIAAVAVFGNPSNKLMVPLTVSPLVGAKTIDLCNGGDPICNANGEDMAAHKVYEKTGMPNQAADFVAGRL